MRASSVFAAALYVAAVSAYGYGNETYGYGNETKYTTTEVVTQYTTYCPYATTIVENNHTYTVTEVCQTHKNGGQQSSNSL